MRFRSEAPPKINGYDRLEEIGRGGFSRVYTAHQLGFERRVALKVITREIDDDGLRAFRREQRITGRLDGHPNIVRVYDAGVTRAGQPYLAMEYLAEGTIADRLRKRGPLPIADALHIGVVLGCAIDAAHELGIVHRDVKPQNVLWSPFVGPVLADFGIAGVLGDHRTDPEAFSVLHAAPEVLAGGPSTPAADVYAVASTLYELLSGRAPFHDAGAPGMPAFLERARVGAVPPVDRPDLPPEVDAAIVRLLRADPDARPDTGRDLASRLRSVQTMLGLEPTPFIGESPTHSVRPASPSASPQSKRPAAPPMIDPVGPDTLPPSALPAAPSVGELLDHESSPAAPIVDRTDPSTVDGSTPVGAARSSRRRRAVVGVVAAVSVAVAGALLLSADRDDETMITAPPTASIAGSVDPLCPPADVGTVVPPPEARPVATALRVRRDGTGIVVTFHGDGAPDTTYVVFGRCRPAPDEDVAVTPLATLAGDARGSWRLDGAPADVEWCFTVGVVEPAGRTRLGSTGSQFRCVSAK